MNIIQTHESIEKYLKEKESRKKGTEVGDLRRKAYEDYVALCENDQKLSSLLDEFKPISKALSYNREKDSNFQELWVHYEDEGDTYIYSKKLFEEACRIHKNWPADKDMIEEEMKNIKSAPIVFRRKSKIDMLERELYRVTRLNDAAKFALETEAFKKDLLDNRSDMLKNLINDIEKIEVAHANEIAQQYVEAYPVIKEKESNCGMEHRVIDGQKHSYEVDFLNQAFDKFVEHEDSME